MDGCHAPVPQGMPGDGRKYTQGTGLLNIAGEKIGAAALWVIRFFVQKNEGAANATAPFLIHSKNYSSPAMNRYWASHNPR